MAEQKQNTCPFDSISEIFFSKFSTVSLFVFFFVFSNFFLYQIHYLFFTLWMYIVYFYLKSQKVSDNV